MQNFFSFETKPIILVSNIVSFTIKTLKTLSLCEFILSQQISTTQNFSFSQIDKTPHFGGLKDYFFPPFKDFIFEKMISSDIELINLQKTHNSLFAILESYIRKLRSEFSVCKESLGVDDVGVRRCLDEIYSYLDLKPTKKLSDTFESMQNRRNHLMHDTFAEDIDSYLMSLNDFLSNPENSSSLTSNKLSKYFQTTEEIISSTIKASMIKICSLFSINTYEDKKTFNRNIRISLPYTLSSKWVSVFSVPNYLNTCEIKELIKQGFRTQKEIAMAIKITVSTINPILKYLEANEDITSIFLVNNKKGRPKKKYYLPTEEEYLTLFKSEIQPFSKISLFDSTTNKF